jgi:hypothetical protein
MKAVAVDVLIAGPGSLGPAGERSNPGHFPSSRHALRRHLGSLSRLAQLPAQVSGFH